MAFSYSNIFSTRQTPQSEPIPGSAMVANSAGGFAFAVDDWTRLHRFLILGSEGGSYYAKERPLTLENARAVARCIESDGRRAVREVVDVSRGGKAPKNDPAVFALAMAAGLGDDATRAAALAALPEVCRIGTHLFQFVEAVQGFRGWGRSLRDAVAHWYLDQDPAKLAYGVVKYQRRNGWTHRDVLRKAHPKATDAATNAVLRYAARRPDADGDALLHDGDTPAVIAAHEAARTADAAEAVRLIRDADLPRESLPTELLTRPEVWEALLERMPMTAMLRNLGNMSKCGLLAPNSDAEATVAARLLDADRLRSARVHPLAMLTALKTYASGHGLRGGGQWTPAPRVVDALDRAFELAFDNVEPTRKRWLLGVDVSGSMGMGNVAGSPLTPAEAAAAMALVTARTEPTCYVHGFADTFRDLGITPRMRLDDVLARTRSMNFGATDCALPMTWAMQNNVDADVFVVLTDGETWFGKIHPVQALRQYRERTGIPARLIVVGMVANAFSIADPEDAGMLDVVGFDTATPAVMREFVAAD